MEANRLFFHPRGLALTLEAAVGADGNPSEYTDFYVEDVGEPGGAVFDVCDPERAVASDALFREHAVHRERECGWVIQPLGDAGRPPELGDDR